MTVKCNVAGENGCTDEGVRGFRCNTFGNIRVTGFDTNFEVIFVALGDGHCHGSWECYYKFKPNGYIYA